jgi:ADP-ribose pyrophosphatase
MTIFVPDSEDELPRFELGEPIKRYGSPVFGVFSRSAKSEASADTMDMYYLRCRNWVNVVPVTADGHIVLIEQHRFGADVVTLETPGGAVDEGENDTTLAALRELEEETRLTSARILALSGFFPNPAIQNNRIQYFIAFDCRPVEKVSTHFDPFERIRLRYVPVAEALRMARGGLIGHALASHALLLAEPYLMGKFSTSLPSGSAQTNA